MARYLLLLRENPAVFKDTSPAEYETIVREYLAWSRALQAQGAFVQGEKLKDEGGKRLRKSEGRLSLSDGPYAESKDVIGGLYVVKADSYAQAAAMAEGCPHLRFGEIELRAIDDV